jgi:hypothetical protein
MFKNRNLSRTRARKRLTIDHKFRRFVMVRFAAMAATQPAS